MKRFTIVLALIISIIILPGCSVFYDVSQNSAISSLPYTSSMQGVKTGSASIFVGGEDNLYPRFSSLITNEQSDIGLYEDDDNIYFKHGNMFGINRQVSLRQSQQTNIDRILSDNIHCELDKCMVMAARAGFIVSVKKGYAGDLVFEYADFSERVSTLQKALISDTAIPLFAQYLPKEFISRQLIEKSIATASTIESLSFVSKTVDALDYTELKPAIVKKMDYLSFTSEYSSILTAPLTEQLQFLKKYGHAKRQEFCYNVLANELNIRQTPSIKATKTGTYERGQEVCAFEFKGIWARTKDGWISTEYLATDMLNDFGPQFVALHKEVERKIFKNAEAQGSIEAYNTYLLDYPVGRYANEAKQVILQIQQTKETELDALNGQSANIIIVPSVVEKHANDAAVIKCAALAWGIDACPMLAQYAATKKDKPLYDVAVSVACTRVISEGFNAQLSTQRYEFSLFSQKTRDEIQNMVGDNSINGLLSTRNKSETVTVTAVDEKASIFKTCIDD